MKYFYIAVQMAENGKFYAYVIRISEHDNLYSKLNAPGIVAANICPTRKRAREIAQFWNDCSRRNGNYLFEEVFA